MNKYIKVILLLVVVISIAVNIIKQQNNELKDQSVEIQPEPVGQPNVISQAEEQPAPVVFDQQKWQAEQDKMMAEQAKLWLSFLSRREVQPMKDDPSYIEAYRDYVYYEGCMMMIGNALYDEDPFQYVLGGRTFEEIPAAQQQTLVNRLDRCVQLSDFSTGVYYAEVARKQLQARYQAIKPKTAKERSLEATLNLLRDFRENHNRLRNARAGEDIDVNLRFELWDIRKTLEQQMPQPLSLFGGYSEADQLLVDELNQQIAEIDQRLEDNKFIDTEWITELEAVKEQLTAQIIHELVNTTSSDAYLAIYGMLTEQYTQIEAPEIAAQLTGGIIIIPDKYASFLEPVVVHFRACELSHPCDLNSRLAENLCLNFARENAPLACETGVIDYYLNHHLSANQLLDVEHIITGGY
ncbi:hypothetical protein OS175_13325 [Marinicella sp. S1101]|uniref:hypothetical protein n=1 Tax=Marinicella marina TaxID=2996016 RepID=UPI002260DE6E|nr:hypothetical protein [Marinicella marina]MCX7554855.1 hypothetical protein [Marinicella marina]MDJ1141513.1 hypothetical protein [Marinicella marina]